MNSPSSRSFVHGPSASSSTVGCHVGSMLAFPEVSVTTVTILDMVTLRYGQIKARRLRWASPSRPHMPGYGLPEGPDGLMPWIWAEQRHCGQGTTDRSPGRY